MALRTLLVVMPFSDVTRPALGVSLLKAALVRDGHPCDVEYLNARFARVIGRDNDVRLNNFSPPSLLGEWVFADDLFGESLPSPAQYYVDVLQPLLSSSPTGSPFASPDEEAEFLAGLLALRTKATAFLDECAEATDWRAYDVVGFTSTFQQNVPALAMARRIKARHPDLFVVMGGANCEGEMGAVMARRFPFLDAVCSGEGDVAFPALVRALAAGGTADGIPGIRTPTHPDAASAAAVRDLDALPVPDFSDFFAQRGGEAGRVTIPIESSRGCWWGEKAHCTFCGLNGATMDFRTKSADRFLDEVEGLVERYGVRDLFAVDNIIDMRYFRTVLPRLAEGSLGVTLFYETKANLRRDQIRLLREAGVTTIQPGIESLSSPILDRMRKGIQAYQNVRLLKWCAEHLVAPMWNLLAGFPHEEAEEYTRQAEAIASLTHLPPPTGVSTVRLDRFSPLFVQGAAAGVRNVRAAAAYGHVYPFPQADLDALAYHFDFDHVDGRDPDAYLGPLKAAVETWRTRADLGRLASLDDGATLAVRDARAGAVRDLWTWTGWERTAYLACDGGATAASVTAALAEGGHSAVTVPEIQAFLDRLVEARLVLPLDGRYVSLAVAGDYVLTVLARHLQRGDDAPEDVREAAGRLYALFPDRFGSHLLRATRAGHPPPAAARHPSGVPERTHALPA